MSDYRDSYNKFDMLYNQIMTKYNIISVRESTSFLTSINKVNKIINLGSPFELNISLYNTSTSKIDCDVVCNKLTDILVLMKNWLNSHYDSILKSINTDVMINSMNKRSQTMFHKFVDILYAVGFDCNSIDSYCRKTFGNEKTINYYAYGAKLALKILTNVPAINRYNSTLIGNIITSSIYEVDNIYGYICTKQNLPLINRLKTVLSSCDDLLTSSLYSLKTEPMNFNTLKFAIMIYYMYTDIVYTVRSVKKEQLLEYIDKLIQAVDKNKELINSNKINDSNLEIIIALTAFIKSIIEIMVRRNMIADDFQKLVNYVK